ncbi:MAG: GNAT family N-acetyltransferase, partial [Micromonosporaceae bacterium]
MTDLVIRPLEPGEEELFLSFDDPGLVGVASTGRDFRAYLGERQYRPEWTWVAVRGGTVLGRAAWWAGPDDPEPLALDWFDFADPEVGVRLLREAKPRTDFVFILPAGWRDDPLVRTHARLRIDAARRAGMTPLVERLHYTWTPADGLAERPARLQYRSEPHDEVIVDVVSRVHSVT